MADKISNAKNEIDPVQARRDTPPVSSSPTRWAHASCDVRLEVEQNEATGAFVYNIVDAKTGAIVGQWSADQMTALRDYVREKQLTLLDTSA